MASEASKPPMLEQGDAGLTQSEQRERDLEWDTAAFSHFRRGFLNDEDSVSLSFPLAIFRADRGVSDSTSCLLIP